MCIYLGRRKNILRQKHQLTSAMRANHLPKLEGAQKFGRPSTEYGHIIFIQAGCDLLLMSSSLRSEKMCCKLRNHHWHSVHNSATGALRQYNTPNPMPHSNPVSLSNTTYFRCPFRPLTVEIWCDGVSCACTRVERVARHSPLTNNLILLPLLYTDI
jgi:hypothetical protein